MSKKILLTICFLFCTYYLVNAQSSWQWGKRGGSADVGSGGPDESVVDMATDPHGNIYVLSYVMETGLNVDGHAITGWGGQDILISSFTCDGAYRWSVDLGSDNDDYPIALRTDTLGGIYITGALYCDVVTDHIGADSSWAGASFKTLFLAKFDTAGNYKWFRMPEPDSVSVWSPGNTGSYDIDVDGGGNSYLLCILDPGAYVGGAYIVTSTSVNMLKYDQYGNFVSGNLMQITGNSDLKMKRDDQMGRYYITGDISGSLSFDGVPIIHSIFIGCFNNSGTFLWQRQNTHNTADPTSRAVIDAHHNIYISSISSGADTFDGYHIVNGGVPVVFKLDTNGVNLWGINAVANAATFCNSITLNGSEVDIAGYYPGLLKWPGYADSLNLSSSSGYHIFITRFNAATGAVLGMDSLASTTGADNDATAMVSDKFGNFYVGGNFAVQLTVNGTAFTSAGGGSDFFVAKYGTNNCDTVHMATLEAPPSFSKSGSNIVVYPNPATDELNIVGILQTTSYRLLNMTGAVLQQGQLQIGGNTVSMQNFAAGIYILEMTGEDGERNIVRVVKE